MNELRQYRMEQDSIGEKSVPTEAYYGIHALRARENFPITGRRVHPDFIRSVVQIKKAAALTNKEVGELDAERADAIQKACDEILAGKMLDQFIVDPIQGGAGTSLNMNANEVIANRAAEFLGGKRGDYHLVSPTDHVNRGQSTNDVIPSAARITTVRLMQRAQRELIRLDQALEEKAAEFDKVIKMGRTQMQDAVPIRLGQEFSAYASAVRRSIERFNEVGKELCQVNLGGTAIGTGVNANVHYMEKVVPNVAALTGLPLEVASDRIDGTQNMDCFVRVSGVVKACAVSLSKMSNDLRLLSSGPRTGFGEIALPPRQNGSSIMPGKVNPVIPEVVSQVAFAIAGNDMTITMAAEAGQLELNAFGPVLFDRLFDSIESLTGAVSTLIHHCILGITAHPGHCRRLVENSVGIITVICPYVGYDTAARIAKEALKTGCPIRQLLLEKELFTPEQLDRILDTFAMTEPGIEPL